MQSLPTGIREESMENMYGSLTEGSADIHESRQIYKH